MDGQAHGQPAGKHSTPQQHVTGYKYAYQKRILVGLNKLVHLNPSFPLSISLTFGVIVSYLYFHCCNDQNF